MDVIEIDAFRVDCILGVLAREQQEAQPLDITIRMHLDLSGPGDSDSLENTVDYAAVVDQIAALAQFGRFRLLETMAQAMCRLILAPPSAGEPRGQVERVDLTLKKPAVLAFRARPGIAVSRSAPMGMVRKEWRPGIWADVLAETKRNGAWRVFLPAGGRIDLPRDTGVMVICGTATVDDRDIGPGVPLPAKAIGTVRNNGDEEVCLLVAGLV